MEPKKSEPQRNPAKDLPLFEHLPPKTKELSLLKDQAEKTTGTENVELNRKIRDKAASKP